MESKLEVCGEQFDYCFIASWIKYIRIQKGYSQEYVAHGICSASYLSCFENGKRVMKKDTIEAILKKLDVDINMKFENIGLIRQNFSYMIRSIEEFDYKTAEHEYNKLCEIKPIIDLSPYSIEFKVYDLCYRFFVKKENYEKLKCDIDMLDNIYDSFDDELKCLYLGISGAVIATMLYVDDGIKRMKESLKIKTTTWIQYGLGIALCFNRDPGGGSYYLERSLESYESSGRYLNAIWCHKYLGTCFVLLNMYEKAEEHFKTALISAERFNLDDITIRLYNELADLFIKKKCYKKSLQWSRKAMIMDSDNIYAVYEYIYACMKLHDYKECDKMFKKYLTEEYKTSEFYLLIYFLYLYIYKFNDEIFYEEVKNVILPYYEKAAEYDICRDIKFKLIEYLESKRKYKEATELYKELIN